MKKICLVITILLSWITAIFAGFSDSINYQGRVFTPPGSNTPVADSLTNVVSVAVYGASSGGGALITKIINNVQTKNGYFNIVISGLGATLDFDSDYWLEITFNGEALTPRQQLVASPYANRAMYADMINPDRTTYGPVIMSAGNNSSAVLSVTNTIGTAIEGLAPAGIGVSGAGAVMGVYGLSQSNAGFALSSVDQNATGGDTGASLYVQGKIKVGQAGTVNSPAGSGTIICASASNPTFSVNNNLCNGTYHVLFTPDSAMTAGGGKPCSYWITKNAGNFTINIATNGQPMDNNVDFDYLIINQ